MAKRWWPAVTETLRAQYRVGFARTLITPPVGSAIAGQFEERLAASVHDDLFARTMVVGDGYTTVALVSCDVLALKASTVRQARAWIEDQTGVPGANCHFFATHTHTGPMVTDILAREADPAVVAALPAQLASAVGEASRRLRPATLVAATSHLHATYNRRFVMRSGKVVMHAAPGNPEVVCAEGPTDGQVQALAAVDDAGRWLGGLVNWACHPITAGGERVFSADFPGGVERFLRRAVDPEFVCLFANGACGDLCPFDWHHPERTPYGFAYVDRLGTALGAEFVKAVSLGRPVAYQRLRTGLRRLAIPLRSADDALRTVEEHLSARQHEVYAAERTWLDAERASSPLQQAEVSALAIGDCLLSFNPAELFCQLGLEIKAAASGMRCMVIELADGCIGYVPTEQAFAGGGYETRLCRSSKLAPAAGGMIVDACRDMAAELRA